MSSDFIRTGYYHCCTASSQSPVAPSALLAYKYNSMCSVIYEIIVNFLEHVSFYKGVFMVFNSNLYTGICVNLPTFTAEGRLRVDER